MSHKGHESFHEELRANRLEQVYKAVTPDRCYTTYDATDKDEVKWRLQHCFSVQPTHEMKRKVVTLPPSTDEDYWREREDRANELREIYAEAQQYRNL